MTRARVIFVLTGAVLTALMSAGCAPGVGDKCTYDRNCGTTLTCDTTIAEGYCLKVGCRSGECPSGSTCVDFGFDVRYCMRACSADDTCRSDMGCRPSQCKAGSEASAASPCSLEGRSFCGPAQ